MTKSERAKKFVEDFEAQGGRFLVEQMHEEDHSCSIGVYGPQKLRRAAYDGMRGFESEVVEFVFTRQLLKERQASEKCGTQ